MAELTEKSFKHLVAAIEAQMEAEAELIVKNGLDQKPPKELGERMVHMALDSITERITRMKTTIDE